MASNDKQSNDKTTASNEQPTKLYRLLEGSITRYEGAENEEGTRKVITYEADGSAAGNQVWLTEKEVEAVGLKKLEEVHGATRGDNDKSKIAAPPAATSLTGAPAGGPVEDGGDAEVNDDHGDGSVNVSEAMATPAGSGTSSNPAVERVLASKKAAAK
jgi:hypothetical protein